MAPSNRHFEGEQRRARKRDDIRLSGKDAGKEGGEFAVPERTRRDKFVDPRGFKPLGAGPRKSLLALKHGNIEAQAIPPNENARRHDLLSRRDHCRTIWR